MGFVMARIFSINNCASGVSTRFFKVIIPIAIRVVGSATGNALSGGYLPGTFSMKLGSTVRKRPVARRSFFMYSDRVITVARGGSCPPARKASATSEPKKLSDGSSAHGSFIRSASVSLRRRVDVAAWLATVPNRSERCPATTS